MWVRRTLYQPTAAGCTLQSLHVICAPSASYVLLSLVAGQLGPHSNSLPVCRTLSLDGCRQLPFIDAGLEALRGLARVAVLNLQGCLTLTDLGLAAIAQMRSLACLNLQDCGSISGVH